MALPYFYDNQTRRIISHFIRIFSGFKVQLGEDEQGLQDFRTVPAFFGGGSRQAHLILNENSENVITSTPRIAAYIDSIELAEDRLGYAGNFDENLTIERKWDPESQTYTQEPGNRYEVNRLQYRPLDFNFRVDILTSNLDQKLQLFEQIVMVFNPALEIQKTENPLDWTAVDVVRLTSVTFDQQGIPRGPDDELQVMSMDFKVETQISPPARVKRQVLIENIIQQIGDGNSERDIFNWDCGDPPYEKIYDTNITTPGNHKISVEDFDTIILLGPNGEEKDESGNLYSWAVLIDQYGIFQSNSSKIRLLWHGDLERRDEDIIGKFQFTNKINEIKFFPDIDTLPQLTLDMVNGVINPHEEAPNYNLPAPSVGTRYLLTDELGPGSQLWGSGFQPAQPGDIIEFDGSNWFIDFDFQSNNSVQYVLDNRNNIYYEINDEGFFDFVNQEYLPGFWRLDL